MSQPDTHDEFYRGRVGFGPLPGRILRRRAVDLPNLEGSGRAWQIVYATRTAFSAPIPASATVISPATVDVAGSGPTLVYCPQFHGLGGSCAPSQLLARGEEPEAGFLAAGLQRGWTVAVPDGPGLGMTDVGPYQFLAGQVGAHAVLDLARAVRDMPELDSRQSPCAVWGFGDGGRTAIWAGETRPEYAPELDLRGVAAGAVVADPGALIREIDGGPGAGLALAGLIGLGRAYRHLPVDHVLLESGREVIKRASTLDAADIQVDYRHQPLGQWCERPDPWNDAMWRYVLANEQSARVAPRVPVHLYHGTEDALVPVAMGRELFSAYRALGVDLSWREYHNSHLGSAADGASEALSRLASYLQRRPTPPGSRTPPSSQTT
ncbi:lipase family protein [Nocardia suismassiliense]|uniref:lipase family protein n=1 Tax=Nocardia suismassiliense TaxID=2077092 RepID=UPI00131F04B3|nr:lipase family protein [Nocardia suismassiliense]